MFGSEERLCATIFGDVLPPDGADVFVSEGSEMVRSLVGSLPAFYGHKRNEGQAPAHRSGKSRRSVFASVWPGSAPAVSDRSVPIQRESRLYRSTAAREASRPECGDGPAARRSPWSAAGVSRRWGSARRRGN